MRVREEPLDLLHPDDLAGGFDPVKSAHAVLARMTERGWLPPPAVDSAMAYIKSGRPRGAAQADALPSDVAMRELGEQSMA